MTFNPSNGSNEFSRYCIIPQFSKIVSRKFVDLTYKTASIPVISANMTSITGSEMALAMVRHGGIACLPRFSETAQTVNLIKSLSSVNVWASVGVSIEEIERARVLIYECDISKIVIDVAHGATEHTLNAAIAIRDMVSHAKKKTQICIGNFANPGSMKPFLENRFDSFKLGVGPGAVCETRLKTGVGMPQILLIKSTRDFVGKDAELISDGGHQSPGDIAKSLAAGANLVMIGSMLATTMEAAGKGTYYGSASQRSYEEQGKLDSYRTTEGISKDVPIVQTVESLMQDIGGGLRSSFSYVGASCQDEFHEKAVILDTFLGKTL